MQQKLIPQKKKIHLAFLDPEQSIQVDQDETILNALLLANIPIKQACTNGVCGVCLTPLLSGEIDYAGRQPHGLNDREKQNGYFLPCIATCKTDISIARPKVQLKTK